MLLAGTVSYTSTQYIDFVDFLYFPGFVYHLFCSFSCSCHSIPECCVMFSGVKLSMGLFVLLLQHMHHIQTEAENILKPYFSEIAINKKCKEIKANVLSEHKRSFVVDMRKDFDRSGNTSQHEPCEMISVSPNLLKDQIIENYQKNALLNL